MKKSFLFTSFFLLLGNPILFAQSSVYTSPKGKYSLKPVPGMQIGSSSLSGQYAFGCDELLASNRVYPTGQVYAFCNEAEVACLRKGLIEQALSQTEDPDVIKSLQDKYEFSLAETDMKLTGCRLSILEGSAGQSFLQNQQKNANKSIKSQRENPS